ADPFRKAAFGDLTYLKPLGGLVGDDRDTRTGIEYEIERLVVAIYVNFYDRPVANERKRHSCLIVSRRGIERCLLAQAAEKVYQTFYPELAIRVEVTRYGEETFVRLCGFFISFGSR